MAPKQRIVDEEAFTQTVTCTEKVVADLISEIFTEKYYQLKIPVDIQSLVQKESIAYLKNRAINRIMAKTTVQHIIMVNLPLGCEKIEIRFAFLVFFVFSF